MLSRRQFLTRTLQGSSLFAVGPLVPQFLLSTAHAADVGKDNILVVIEMTGGNDGLNTVIPYADDLYHKARKTLRLTKEQVIRVDDHIGLNPAMQSFNQLLQKGQLAIVQGVGYPNPDRSHFESMDIWQSADVKRRIGNGWIGRSVPDLQDKRGNVPVFQIGANRLPLALQGAPAGVVSVNDRHPYKLNLHKFSGGSAPSPSPVPTSKLAKEELPAQVGTVAKQTREKARFQLIKGLAESAGPAGSQDLLAFVRRRQLQTYTTLERLEEILNAPETNGNNPFPFTNLSQKLKLVARLIEKGLGTRVFYVSIEGFDTHSGQLDAHRNLLQELSDSIAYMFNELQRTGHDKRVVAMTFSEFGRRVEENGSRGTDHGAASCMFLAGPAVKSGPIGQHPSLSDLDAGDLKFHTDFRRVYATLLDEWLRCDSKLVLGDRFEHVSLLKAKT